MTTVYKMQMLYRNHLDMMIMNSEPGQIRKDVT